MDTTNLINFEAFFKITYGLYIVSSGYSNNKNGFISNSVFQVTAEPPQFAVCCNKENYTAEVIKNSRAFSISVLEKDTKKDLIGIFGYKSGRLINKFEKIKFSIGNTGIPIVEEDSIAWFECELIDIVDVGTHFIFIGKLVASSIINSNKDPLTYIYYREVKKGTAPKNAPTYIDKSKFEKKIISKEITKNFECQVCGYIYDSAIGDSKGGIVSGTLFEDLPNDWVCPICGTRKTDFVEIH